MRRRGKILIPIAVVLLLLLGTGGVLYYLGFADDWVDDVLVMFGQEEVSDKMQVNQFFNMNEIVANLPRDGGKQKFLKISISLEVKTPEDVVRLKSLEPRIRDSFESFLRELHVREIEGSRGIYKVKEELLARTNLIVAPTRVYNVLFRDLLIQ